MTELFVNLFYSYWLLGALFSLFFIGWGAARLDHEAQTMHFGLRLLLLPGSMALWPLLLQKFLQRQPPSSTDSKPPLP